MYHKNAGWINKIKYSVHPISILVVSIIIFLTMAILFYRFYRKMQLNDDDFKRFSQYISEYSVDGGLSNDAAKFIISSFTFDDNMMQLTSTTANGVEIEGYNWNSHTEAFLELINLMNGILLTSMDVKSSYYKSDEVWKVLRHFVTTVFHRIPLPPTPYNMPWGTNWYQFSISFPLFLVNMSYSAYTLFGKADDDLQRNLSVYISNYFVNPPRKTGVISMGWARDGPNAVMMAVPYIGGKLLLKNLDKEDNICLYAKDYCTFNFVNEGEGLYSDMGYVFHTTLRAYGYIYSSFNDILLISKFFNLGGSGILQNVYKVMEHPTIPLHFSAWFTRSPNLGSGKRTGDLGFFVVDSIRGVVCKTKDWYLGFNGQANHLCFYESDKDNYTWGQIWTSARVFLYMDSESAWKRDFVTYYPGVISYGNVVQEMPTETTTTTTFLPSNGETIISSLNDVIGMRNKYLISYSNYIINVVELVLVTTEGLHTFLQIKPDMELHSKNALTVAINLGSMKVSDGSGIGTCYKFDKNYSFVYNDKNDVVTGTVKDKATDLEKDHLQIRPKISVNNEGIPMASVSYSTIHSKVNSCLVKPTENSIDLIEYNLTYDAVNDLLWLRDKTNKVDAVSKPLGVKIKNNFSLNKNILLKKYSTIPKIRAGSLIGNEYHTFTDSRYQMKIDF